MQLTLTTKFEKACF